MNKTEEEGDWRRRLKKQKTEEEDDEKKREEEGEGESLIRAVEGPQVMRKLQDRNVF